MDSDNWVVQNLENALNTWNTKMAEVWSLLTTSPQSFKGGGIWHVIVQINGAVKGIGLALLVLFFLMGVVKTCGNLADVKRPEHALKLFIRFAIAKGVVTYGLDLMLALFDIAQGAMRTIMNASGIGSATKTTLPSEMVTAIEDCGFFESIPLWAVTLIGSLFITVMSFIIINGTLIHHHTHGIRQILPSVYVHGYRAYPTLDLRRAAYAEHRGELSEELCGSVP